MILSNMKGIFKVELPRTNRMLSYHVTARQQSQKMITFTLNFKKVIFWSTASIILDLGAKLLFKIISKKKFFLISFEPFSCKLRKLGYILKPIISFFFSTVDIIHYKISSFKTVQLIDGLLRFDINLTRMLDSDAGRGSSHIDHIVVAFHE